MQLLSVIVGRTKSDGCNRRAKQQKQDADTERERGWIEAGRALAAKQDSIRMEKGKEKAQRERAGPVDEMRA